VETKDLLKSVSLSFVQLQSLNVQKSGDRKYDRVEVARRYSLDVLSISERGLRIGLDLKVFCKPDGPFKLDMEVVGVYRFTEKHDFDTNDVTRHIDTLAEPLFARASLIAAFLTEEMIGIPVIFPPFGDPEEKE